MKPNMIPVFLLVILSCSFSNDKDCNRFKTGTFEIESNDGKTYTIIRSKNKQIEKVAETGVVSEFDVKWLTTCSYMLYNRKLIKGEDEFPEMKHDTIYNEISGIEGNRFKVTTILKKYDFKSEAFLRKIK